MELPCFAVLLPFLINGAVGHPGEPVMYLPPFEVRTLDGSSRMFPFSSQQQQPMASRMLPQQQVFHTTPAPPPPPPPPPPVETTEKPHNHHNFTVNEFLDVLNGMEDNEDHSESRAASERDPAPGYGYPPPSYPPYSPYPRPPYLKPPSYGPYAPAPHHEPAYAPAPTKHAKTALTSLFKPATTKVASKVSGLIELILTLFTGSAPDDLELKGFKDIVINGIIKPLLIAKGGIKSLISKLVIPVISLLLINLEVLITIWWLWEECPQPHQHSYSKPAYYNSYNNYNHNSY